MSTCQKMYTIREELRPADLPDGWLMFNGPRPMYGMRAWQGEWCRGSWYAAVDPSEAEAVAESQKLNAELDGRELVFLPREFVLSEQRKRYIAQLGERALKFVDEQKNVEGMIERYLELANMGKMEVAYG